MSENLELTKELIWARKMLGLLYRIQVNVEENTEKRFFIKYLLSVKSKIISAFALNIAIFLTAISILFLNHIMYAFILLFICACLSLFTFLALKKEKKKNFFRILSKTKMIDDNIFSVLEYNVVKHQDSINDIIDWRCKKNIVSSEEIERFASLKDLDSWDYEQTIRMNCHTIGLLMVYLQRFLHKHKEIYHITVKEQSN